MVIFIDESGIHQQAGHSTTAVVYVEIKKLEKFEKQILQIEENLRIASFHWANERWLIRQKFLSKIIELDFMAKVAIFENPTQINRMLEIVFQHLITEPEVKKIFIDGKKPKWYERKLKKVLRDKGISVKKLRTVRKDEGYPGIQLADCLAGLLRYHYDNPLDTDATRWFKKLKRNKKLFGQFIFESQK